LVSYETLAPARRAASMAALQVARALSLIAWPIADTWKNFAVAT